MHVLHRISLTMCFVVSTACFVFAQTPVVSAQAGLPPGELADPIGALMAAGGQHVRVGAATLDFWWVKTLPLTSESHEVSWTSVDEGTLVGAVTLSAPYPDVRGRTIPAGIYTLRYGIVPPAGERSAASSPEGLLLLAPVAEDEKTDSLGHDDLVALAMEMPGASSPLGWRLESPASGGVPGSTQTSESGQSALIIAVPVSRDGRDAGTLTFGLVLVGTPPP